MERRKFVLLVAAVLTGCLSACGANDNSKVDQVVKSQIEAENYNNTGNTEDKKDTEAIVINEDNTETNGDLNSEVSEVGEDNKAIDIDLTQMSSTMIYSEVYNMLSIPQNYIGKMVKMNGAFATYEDGATGQMYFACIISDAAACCSQGIEFKLKGKHKYPEDYPKLGENITVTGEFETYQENGYIYCRLKGAVLE